LLSRLSEKTDVFMDNNWEDATKNALEEAVKTIREA